MDRDDDIKAIKSVLTLACDALERIDRARAVCQAGTLRLDRIDRPWITYARDSIHDVITECQKAQKDMANG